jgi:CheY-like chemotaxis protein
MASLLEGYELRRETILLVEDDPDTREAVREVLALRGYDVHAAPHGLAGLELLPRMPRPCVALVDLVMPVVDGLGFLRRLQSEPGWARWSTLPVIAMTGSAESAPPGAAGFLRKPVLIDALLRAVSAWCGRRPIRGRWARDADPDREASAIARARRAVSLSEASLAAARRAEALALESRRLIARSRTLAAAGATPAAG